MLFGSSANGFGTIHSDLDISMKLPGTSKVCVLFVYACFHGYGDLVAEPEITVRHQTISDHFGSCLTKNQFARTKYPDKVITKI